MGHHQQPIIGRDLCAIFSNILSRIKAKAVCGLPPDKHVRLLWLVDVSVIPRLYQSYIKAINRQYK